MSYEFIEINCEIQSMLNMKLNENIKIQRRYKSISGGAPKYFGSKKFIKCKLN